MLKTDYSFKIIELFAGIGSQVAAFKRLGLPFEVVGISEIDRFAIQSYEAINGHTRNYGDITKIDKLEYADLWTYSSPCQDFSNAGKQQGLHNNDGSLTRSGLLLHVERLLADSVIRGDQPKYLLLENVKALVSKKFKPDFDRWLERLEQLGYTNYWQVLNAKDYGVPQNRERVFVVSIRKDVDTQGYTFPEKIPLIRKLKDVLEPVVDEKYYLSDEKVARFLAQGNVNPSGKGMNGAVCSAEICNTLTTNKGEGLKIKEVSNTIRSGGKNSLDNHGWDIVFEVKILDDTQGFDGIRKYNIYSPTLRAERQGLKVVEPRMLSQKRTEYGKQISKQYKSGKIKESRHNMTTMLPKLEQNCRIRKLTPRECWRLMGFTDIEFDCAQISGVSNSQLYKQAGNSIVVDVLTAIFRKLFCDKIEEKETQLELLGGY